MNHFKKLLLIIISASIVLSLSGCTKDKAPNDNTSPITPATSESVVDSSHEETLPDKTVRLFGNIGTVQVTDDRVIIRMIDGTVETVSRDGSGFPDISVSSDMATEISGIYTVVLTDKSGKTATITLSAENYEKLVAWISNE